MSEYTWELLPHFFVRSTGFPYEWIERLAFSETVVALDTLLDIEEQLEIVQKELQEVVGGAEQNPLQRTLARQVKAALQRRAFIKQADGAAPQANMQWSELIEHWNELLRHCQECEERARSIFAQEMVERRRILYNYACDERFQEATWLSSPQMYEHGLRPYLEHWSAEQRPSEMRRIERQLISYLQRFCVKNDTASFFGPINYGDFAPSCAAIGSGAGRVQQRKTFMAYWAVTALAESIAQDGEVRPYLCPRLHPLCQVTLTNDSACIGGKVTLTLSDQQCKLLQAIKGQQTLQQIATLLALPLDGLLKEIERLEKLHLVVLRVEVPVIRSDALKWLVEWVHALPSTCTTRAYWCEVVDRCQALQDQFTTAPFAERREILQQLEEWFAQATQRCARREGGQLYADRLLLHEECYGGMGVISLGKECRDILQTQLAPILDLYASHACALHQALQQQGVQSLMTLAADSQGRMPLLTFSQKLGVQADSLQPCSSAWHQALYERIAEQADERVVTLEMTGLPQPDRALLASLPLIASPDIMLITRDETTLRAGDFALIMAECHDTLMVWGWGLYFHPRREDVEAEGARLLSSLAHTEEGTCANVLPGKRAKIIPFEYPGPTIEIGALSEKAEAERIPIGAVETAICEGKPVLHAPGYPLLRLYNGELSSFMHNIFALPRIHPFQVELPTHTPRIIIGETVFQREQWRFTRQQILPGKYTGASFELLRDMHRAAKRTGLPRYLFLRVPGERKPVFIDRYNYFLLELLHYLVPAETAFTMQEMLPTPEQLWLRNEGGTYCAELRLSLGYTARSEGEHHD